MPLHVSTMRNQTSCNVVFGTNITWSFIGANRSLGPLNVTRKMMVRILSYHQVSLSVWTLPVFGIQSMLE
jgi:hypothetical protein